MEKKFHIALNKRVRLRLRGEMVELEGRLTLDSLELPPPEAETIRLRIGSTTFENTDIDYFHPVED